MVSTQEIFFLFLLLASTDISSTNCDFICKDDIGFNPTINLQYFLYFQKVKTEKVVSD